MSLVVTTDFQLNRVAAPNLPRAPIQYNPQYQEQLNNVSRLYFNRIDSILSQLTGKKFTELRIPYGAFSSDQDQVTTANTATLMTFNTTDFANDVSISSSQITVVDAGIYNLQFSAQLKTRTLLSKMFTSG